MCFQQTLFLDLQPPFLDIPIRLVGSSWIPTHLVTAINPVVRTPTPVFQLPKGDKVGRVIDHLPNYKYISATG